MIYFLEPRIKDQDVLKADMVALKCNDCGFWQKWCPKDERKHYIKKQKKVVKIRDLTFGQLEEYVKKNCCFSNGKMKIQIMGYNSYPNSTECITGLPTNDSNSIILQGDMIR